jgi:hypothetical protein
MKILSKIFLLSLIAFGFASCDEEIPDPATGTFTVTVENVLSPKKYLATGTVGGLIMPDNEMSFSFNAGKGHYLSFATMFVQSNDLFYGFDDTGLALYDANGDAVTGDVTSSVTLWDAGTEVNEMPGSGPNQAPRQSAANTGMDENGLVQLVNDAFTYPMTSAVIEVTLTHDGGTEFTATIKNVSSSSSLPTPFAGGVWGIHGSGDKLFEAGTAASAGLEAIAEDGDNAAMAANLTENTGYASPFAPGVWALHESGQEPIFTANTADNGDGLEGLAEDGDPSTLNAALEANNNVSSNGVFNTPDGASAAGPLMPGNTYSFTFTAEEGDYLSLATMLVHTNDLFYGFGGSGIALFENGTAISGDVTSKLELWDAGTEVNEYPGAGNNQPARGGAMSGADEGGLVRITSDAFTYPANSDAIKITITKQ